MSRSQLATKTLIAEARQYSHIEVEPLTGSFGALVNGIQIADALEDDALLADVRQT